MSTPLDYARFEAAFRQAFLRALGINDGCFQLELAFDLGGITLTLRDVRDGIDPQGRGRYIWGDALPMILDAEIDERARRAATKANQDLAFSMIYVAYDSNLGDVRQLVKPVELVSPTDGLASRVARMSSRLAQYGDRTVFAMRPQRPQDRDQCIALLQQRFDWMTILPNNWDHALEPNELAALPQVIQDELEQKARGATLGDAIRLVRETFPAFDII